MGTVLTSPVYHRLGELSARIRKNSANAGYLTLNGLTTREIEDLIHSLNVHESVLRKLSNLHNLADAAHIIGDEEEEHRICKDIDTLLEGRLP